MAGNNLPMVPASKEDEKEPQVARIEASNHSSDHVAFDVMETKRLLRKIDWALLPFFALLYLLSFLDRANIGNARLAGLEKDLGMKGLDYNVCS